VPITVGMFLAAFVAVCLASAVLAGGRLAGLAELRLRRPWLVAAALVVQFAAFRLPGLPLPARALGHLASYGAAGWFMVANRRIPGLWLVGLGAGLNLAAIAANGGVMPAAPAAAAAAGLQATPPGFSNSAVIPGARLTLLGDVFAIPRPWPFHNVFSLGDLLIALGAAVLVHRATGSRLLPAGTDEFATLARRPRFVRLWASQAVSNLGDWTYALAVAALLAARTREPRVLAGLLVAQVAPAALAGAVAGPLVDRVSRMRLMVGTDLLRGLAVASLLLVGTPSLAHLYLVAACLGLFGSVFQPSLQATLPTVVGEDQVVAANAAVSATYHAAVMVGPAIGGLLVVHAGGRAAFALNAVSFALSAVLLAGLRLPAPGTGDPAAPAAPAARARPGRDLAEGVRYAAGTPLVRGILLVVALVMVAAAAKTPLESLFVLGTLARGPEALGLVAGAWGAGMVLGSVAAPAAARRWPRERLLAAAVATVGLAVLAGAGASGLTTVLVAWLAAGAANAIANVSYESLLQERTPDALRGRVFAATEAVLDGAFLAGAFLAARIATLTGVRVAYTAAGLLLLGAAVLARLLLPAPRPLRPAA
jgi:MFS family permease